jgi:glutaminyl-tRNA synthetase
MEGETVLPIREKKKKDKKDNKPNPRGSKEPKASVPPKKEKAANLPAPPTDPSSMFKEGFLAAVYQERANLPIFTRFPPEPNGYLHIGHSKAIAINFGFARFHDGHCYLRYDDTNPEAEEEKYFLAIQEMIQWLGFKPFDITYSSDHFDKLYELAEKLIQVDKAYVCHCTGGYFQVSPSVKGKVIVFTPIHIDAEVKLQRGGENHGPRYACSHRNRPVEESLSEFRAMRDGKYKPKESFLRMKQNLEDGNPQMWDLTAYRILDAAHHRTGSKWRIYPTYDFTHCLCDSFEKISHSLCTTEFILSRTSYEWLCDALEIFKPMQRELVFLICSTQTTLLTQGTDMVDST